MAALKPEIYRDVISERRISHFSVTFENLILPFRIEIFNIGKLEKKHPEMA